MQVNPHYVSGLVQSLDSATLSEQKLSSELSSGLSVTSLSDNPVAASQASLLGSAISRDDSFVQNAATTEGLMQVSDGALGSVVTQVTSALSVAIGAVNGTNDLTDMTAAGSQLSSIRDEVLALANTSYGGTYVFAGSKGNTQPFTLNTSSTPATVTYNGDNVTGSITTSSGQQISTGLSGAAVFTGVLTALNNLVADFSSGNASGFAAADSTTLTAGLTTLSAQRATLDSSLSRLQSASTYAQTDATEQTAAQGNLVADDTATVATGLSAVERQVTALDSVISALEKGSLFNDMQ
jgi:flagellar hook-associated protein 3 FlgL